MLSGRGPDARLGADFGIRHETLIPSSEPVEPIVSIIELYQRTRSSSADLIRFLHFGIVGASGMAVDLGVLSLLTSVTSYPVARAAAIGVAMIWNFGCNRAITFRDAAEGPLLQQFWRFVVSCSLGAVVNWSTSLLLVSKIAFFREHVLLSAVAGVAAGYLLNFQLCRRWVFGAGPSE